MAPNTISNKRWVLINTIMGLFFSLALAAQYNDLDKELWMVNYSPQTPRGNTSLYLILTLATFFFFHQPIYGFAACMCFLEISPGKKSRYYLLTLIQFLSPSITLPFSLRFGLGSVIFILFLCRLSTFREAYSASCHFSV